MNNFFYKFGQMMVMLALVLVLPMTASAGYVDEEVSAGNSMTAGSLDMVLSGETAISGTDLLRGTSFNVGEVTVINSGSVNADYSAQFVKTGGDDALCDALVLDAKEQGISVYNGQLSSFDQAVGDLDAGDSFDWDLVVSLPTGALDDAALKSCSFDIKFSAAQSGLSGGGYSDDEVFAGHSVTSGDWVAPAIPTQTGYNENDENDTSSYPTPRPINELECIGGITNINNVSIHWTDVAGSNGEIKYQRQYSVGAGGWLGNEIYINPYTTYRSFGGGGGSENIYGTRVRAWKDKNNNNNVDSDEPFSEWSNTCQITFDKTAPTSTFITPVDNDNFSGTPIEIVGSTTDNNAVSSVELVSAPYDTMTNTCGVTYTTITTLTNLTPGTPYSWDYDWTPAAVGSYCIKAHGTDAAGNVEASPLVKNVTYDPTVATGNAPIISNIQVAPGSAPGVLATVTWTTDISATSNVLFGPHSVPTSNTSADRNSGYSFASPTSEDSDADNTSHSVGLIATGQIGSPMYFRVVSKNASGQETKSQEQAFLIDMNTFDITFLPAGSFAQSTTNPTTGQTPNATNTISLPGSTATGSVGFAQSSTPTSTTGQTPNVGDIVLNEIMPNPKGNDGNGIGSVNCTNNGECGEWVELYNNTNSPIDVVGWKIKDTSGKSWKITVAPTAGNAFADNDGDLATAETVVPAKGYLVVYRNGASMGLNNTGSETVSLDDGAHGSAAILMDTHSFDENDFYEGKSIARFPDGVGVWVDPEGTPGDKNKLGADELEILRGQTFEQCFASGEKLENSEKGTLCDPIFLEYIGMIDDVDSQDLALTELLPVDVGVSDEEEIIAQIEADKVKKAQKQVGLAQIEADGTNPSALAGTSPSKGEEEIVTPALEEGGEVAQTIEGVVDEIVEEKVEVVPVVGVIDEVMEVDNGVGGTALIAGGEVVATVDTDEVAVDNSKGEIAQIGVGGESESIDDATSGQGDGGSEQVIEVIDIDEVELVQDDIKEVVVEVVKKAAQEVVIAVEAAEAVEIEEVVEVDEVLEQDNSDEQILGEKLEESKKIEKQVLDVEEAEVIEDNQSGGGSMGGVVGVVGVGIDSAGVAN